MLWGISNHPDLAESWMFKGGTCLKKCFFETYRFSEDLDFTLTNPAHIDAEFLGITFREISERIYDETGIELPAEFQEFDIHENPRGNLSCQGKVGYRGPVSPKGKNIPRIKLDLTADEHVVLPPTSSPVYHAYSDEPEGGIAILSYDYIEAFAEKTRALMERTRPRDLYDVINLYRNDGARPSASALLDVLTQKCDFKGIDLPSLSDIEGHRQDLEGGWAHMLAHQLPALPPVETFWDELSAFLDWLLGGAEPDIPAAYVGAVGEVPLRERTLRLPLTGTEQSYLEVIRFAASNRLCVDLIYQDSKRRIEPYSLRRTKDDNIILHEHNIDKNKHRSYRVDRIEGAHVTDQSFVPRFEIELTPQGTMAIPPTTTQSSTSSFSRLDRPVRATRARAPRRASFSTGPTYVYECSYCGKRFNRKSQTRTLNPHKDKSGYPCPGRYAHWVDTRY